MSQTPLSIVQKAILKKSLERVSLGIKKKKEKLEENLGAPQVVSGHFSMCEPLKHFKNHVTFDI